MSQGGISNQHQADQARSARDFWSEQNVLQSSRQPPQIGTPRGGGHLRAVNVPSPLQTFEPTTVSSPRSPGQAQYLSAAHAGDSADIPPPLSPGRVRAAASKEGADPVFDAVKAAASRDALEEQAATARLGNQPESTKSSFAATSQTPAMAARKASTGFASRSDLKPSVMRTGSLDSQISLTSSPSQSLRHQSESSEIIDIPALIASAGSPEAAIKKLLQERQTNSAHNAQLWRLVEKQRTMILGLNKDLERTLKDKDRYRKKLKDHLVSSSSVATLSGTAHRPNDISDREHSHSPAPSDRLEGSQDDESGRKDNNIVVPDRSQSSTPQPTIQLSSSPSSCAQPLHMIPMQAPFANPPLVRSPTHASNFAANTLSNGMPAYHIPTGTPRATPTEEQNPLDAVRVPSGPTTPSVSQDVRKNSPSAPSSPQQGFSSPKKRHGQASRKAPPAPSPPQQGFSSPKERHGQASRKAPPAPLDLSQQVLGRADLPQTEHSESDYEDDASTELRSNDRGRRKTREDDERDRQGLLINEPMERSKFVKSVEKSKSRSPHRLDHPGSPESGYSVRSGCMSPEEPGSPHVAQVQTYHSLNSINAVLKTPQDAEFGPEIKRNLVAPSAPNLLSPGLPLSPRPVDRPMNSPMPRALLSSIPMTPRAGLALSPRAPRQPIPMPPQTPLSMSSPHLLRAEGYAKQAQQLQNETIAERVLSPPASEYDKMSINNASRSPSDVTSISGASRSPGSIFRGLMSEQYPGLLLPPNALPSIYVKVDSSRLRPSRHSYMAPKQAEDNPVFTLAVYARSDRNQLWRVEKTLAALTALDQQVKSASDFEMKLPEKTLFAGHAPARIDARRSALGLYFDKMLDTPMDEQAATMVCAFFSADAIGTEVAEYFQPSMQPVTSVDQSVPVKVRPRKDGYLTKRGKNFGGWKARYFVLDGPSFKYFEAPGGAQLGAIKLTSAQIGKQSTQSQQSDDDEDDQYRHAFLILEPKKKDSSSHVRHVLCAESDEERDAWVACLLQYVEKIEEEAKSPQDSLMPGKSPRLQKSMNDLGRPPLQPKLSTASKSSVQGLSYNDTVAAEAPTIGGRPGSPTSPFQAEADDIVPRSLMVHGNILGDPAAWGNSQPSTPAVRDRERDKEKKRSIFGFSRGRTSSDAVPGLSSPSPTGTTHSVRAVFGVPLAEVAEFATPDDIPTYLPAVVYRSIEYLRAKNAVSEEGIFRLSGSNILIKALRERFNTEGDVKLLAPDEPYYDIHAIASLLKLYLRELPASILTRDLHMEFLSCLEMEEGSKVEMFNVLVNKLPRVNRELLEKLSAFLREIVDNERVNKMSVRNVGIVFSPTLNIPAPLITLFVTDHSVIFGPPVDISTTPLANRHAANGSDSLDSIRSPRKQMFSDLPTPTYAGSGIPGQQKALTMQDAQRLRQSFDVGFAPMQQTFAPIQSGLVRSPASSNLGNESSVTSSGQLSRADSREDVPVHRLLKRQSGQFLMNVGMLPSQRKYSQFE